MIDLGLSTSLFRSEYLERKPALVQGALTEFPDATSDFSEGLRAADHYDGRVVVFLDEAPIPYGMFTEVHQDVNEARPRISIESVEALMQRGATVVVNRIDRHTSYARRLCDAIQAFTREVATANSYFAISGKGSFGAHWDTHDVLAVQISGRKRWTVWKPTHLLPDPSHKSRTRRDEIPARPIMETVLNAGDALYIPRGWWHAADPIPGHHTMHLAVGLHTSTVTDYIAWLAENILTKNPDLRQCFARATENPNAFSRYMEAIKRSSVDPNNMTAFAALHDDLLKPIKRYVDLPPTTPDQ